MVGIVKVTNGQVGHRASAKNALIFFPKAASALEQDLGGSIVMQLPDGALFGAREGFKHFNVAQHRERHGDDCVIAGFLEPSCGGLIMDGDIVRRLVDGDHFGTETDIVLEVGQKGMR